MLRNTIKATLLLFLFFLFCTCSHNRMDVDIETVSIPQIKFQRLEKDLFSITRNNVDQKTAEIKKNYGFFFERYISSFIDPAGTADSAYADSILHFVNDKDMRSTFELISRIYTDDEMEKINAQLLDGIKRYHFFFPKKQTPKYITTLVSGFNYYVADVDSTLGIGLDMYLGEDAVFYQMLKLPQYQTRMMNKNYIPSDVMRGWMISEFDNDTVINTLIHHTIFYGKILYAVKALVPHVEDSVIIGYTSKQMKYCGEYEKNLWGYMAEKNRLYENDMRTVQELTGEGPFTGAISKECPPGIAKWIGWQIVKSYMEKNETVTLEELMKETDAQKILNKSKYRP
jgi:hypothetical protein